ncbi:MAG: aminotransferase class V-fold PLP-dependent enzyme [candidate division WOR-3 bacterium]
METTSIIDRLRELFPVLGHCTYLNHAGTGPLPRTAAKAIAELAERYMQCGDLPFLEGEAVLDETRRLAADLMHLAANQIAFTRNTSAGLILAINAIPWQPGDNLVMMSDAFPTSTYPYYHLLPGVERRGVTSADLTDGLERLSTLVDTRTRAVALDWVNFLSGAVVDIRSVGDFCRRRGIWFIVDAMQGLGVLDEDFGRVGADFVAAGGNKWLLGPQGIGILAIGQGVLERMRPANIGWLSAQWGSFEDVFTPRPLRSDAGRLEEGTRNYLGVYGLRESLRILHEAGMPAVMQRVRRLVGILSAGLERLGWEVFRPAGAEPGAGIVSCRRPGVDISAVFARLIRANVVCALRQGWLRVSPHFYNSEDDIERFLAVVSD